MRERLSIETKEEAERLKKIGVALIIVDGQYDFCPGGKLAVAGGDKAVRILSMIAHDAANAGWLIVTSRDWHPERTSHFDKWPVHCVAGTKGAEFHKDLVLPDGTIVISKGMGDGEDAYSAFDGTTEDGWTLEEVLDAAGITEVYVGGLATDYCVKFTALDAVKNGFKTTFLRKMSRAVNLQPGDEEAAVVEMNNAGVLIYERTSF